eukprot:EG_transcript_28359
MSKSVKQHTPTIVLFLPKSHPTVFTTLFLLTFSCPQNVPPHPHKRFPSFSRHKLITTGAVFKDFSQIQTQLLTETSEFAKTVSPGGCGELLHFFQKSPSFSVW